MNLQNHPEIAIIASGPRKDVLSAYFTTRCLSIRWVSYTSMTAFLAAPHSSLQLVVLDSQFAREYLENLDGVPKNLIAIVPSEDPELDWVGLGRPQNTLRLVRPERMLRAISCEIEKLLARRDKSSRRQRLVVPPSARRGIQPISETRQQKVRTARLQLCDGTYDLSHTTLRQVASRLFAEKKTGILKIRNGEETAELHLSHGQMQRAIFCGTEGLAALVRFAHWSRGFARWSDEEVANGATLDPDTARMLIGIEPATSAIW